VTVHNEKGANPQNIYFTEEAKKPGFQETFLFVANELLELSKYYNYHRENSNSSSAITRKVS
jgi:hypothetical protein